MAIQCVNAAAAFALAFTLATKGEKVKLGKHNKFWFVSY